MRASPLGEEREDGGEEVEHSNDFGCLGVNAKVKSVYGIPNTDRNNVFIIETEAKNNPSMLTWTGEGILFNPRKYK
jgi:hypothetical protein